MIMNIDWKQNENDTPNDHIQLISCYNKYT